MSAPTAKKPAARTRAASQPASKSVEETPVEDVPTPSEQVDSALEREELRRELLANMPALRPAYRFRLGHRNAFHNLSLEAVKSGAFDRDNLDYDLSKPADIEAYQKLAAFVVSIDEWAETIAEDKDAYIEWSEEVGNGEHAEETFMALYATYRADLGE